MSKRLLITAKAPYGDWRPSRSRGPRRDGYGDGVGLHLSQIDEADELLTNDPLALLVGMVLD